MALTADDRGMSCVSCNDDRFDCVAPARLTVIESTGAAAWRASAGTAPVAVPGRASRPYGLDEGPGPTRDQSGAPSAARAPGAGRPRGRVAERSPTGRCARSATLRNMAARELPRNA